VVGYRSTKRICGDFEQLGGPEERAEAHRLPSEGIDAPFLAVDHADRRSDLQARVPQRLDGLEGRAPGRDHVLDEADALPGAWAPSSRFEVP